MVVGGKLWQKTRTQSILKEEEGPRSFPPAACLSATHLRGTKTLRCGTAVAGFTFPNVSVANVRLHRLDVTSPPNMVTEPYVSA